MTRGIVAVEMLSCNPNGIMEFRECPSLQQVLIYYILKLICTITCDIRTSVIKVWFLYMFLNFRNKMPSYDYCS